MTNPDPDILRAVAAFAAAASILTITPGVDTALVLRNITAGWRPAAAAGAGVIVGCLMWGATVAAGVSVLIASSEFLFRGLCLAGAVYLVLMGLRLFLQPRRAFETAAVAGRPQLWTAFRAGLLTNALNPKVGLFYLTFLPQFIPQRAPAAAFIMLLVGVHILLSATWFGVLIVASTPLRRWLKRPAVIAAVDRTTGVVLVGVGLRILITIGRF
jgi:threonine/homoserine/homoserine lactone efflux protein